MTGLGNEGNAQYIQLDLQSRGYDVSTEPWFGNVSYDTTYGVVVAHSAGSVQAQAYALKHPDVAVIIMGSPIDADLPNVITVGQYYDPVSVLGLFFSLSGDLKFDVVAEGSIHDKNAMYDAVKDQIPEAGTFQTEAEVETFSWSKVMSDGE